MEMNIKEKIAELLNAENSAPMDELSEDALEGVAGGGVYDGNNTGWYYGPCHQKGCSGKRYVMQINYKNLIVCTTCNHWVEF